MITALLIVVGAGLMIAGLAHAWLPRALGWTATALQDAGALSALVVRMHVYFLGLFLIMVGALTVLAVTQPPSVLARALYGAAALLFAVRAVVEFTVVRRAVAAGPPRWRRLHRLALGIWPMVTAVYAVASAYTT